MKLSNEELLDKIEKKKPNFWGKTYNKNWFNVRKFIFSLDLTKEQFDILGDDDNIQIRYIIAQHPKLPLSLMYKFSEDKSDLIRKEIASNPKLPTNLIHKLLKDKNLLVREKIFRHPKLPEDLMYELIEDKNENIRKSIAQNPNLPNDLIIRALCNFSSNKALGNTHRLTHTVDLKFNDLEKAYDLIRESKYINKKDFEFAFDYIIDEFPEISKLAKMFKKLVLKLKKDLK